MNVNGAARKNYPYSIECRLVGHHQWQPEGSYDVYATPKEAQAAADTLEDTNDDGDALEYRVVSR